MIILPTVVLLIYIQYFHALPIGGNCIETNQKCFIPMLIYNFKALTLTSVNQLMLITITLKSTDLLHTYLKF